MTERTYTPADHARCVKWGADEQAKEAAGPTKRPWRAEYSAREWRYRLLSVDPVDSDLDFGRVMTLSDAALIVAARNAWPGLLTYLADQLARHAPEDSGFADVMVCRCSIKTGDVWQKCPDAQAVVETTLQLIGASP